MNALSLLLLLAGNYVNHETGMLIAFLAFAASNATARTAAPPTQWTRADMQAFKAQLSSTGIPLPSLLLMLCAESNLNPRARYRNASFGLNQAQAALLQSVGYMAAPESYAQLSVQQQIPWIRKMLAEQTRWIGYTPTSGTELLRMQLSPVAARARAHVIYDRATDAVSYDANKHLDVAGKGRIDMADLGAWVDRVTRSPTFVSHLALLESL